MRARFVEFEIDPATVEATAAIIRATGKLPAKQAAQVRERLRGQIEYRRYAQCDNIIIHADGVIEILQEQI